MAKGKKSVFFCQNCGHEEAKWLGQCPGCGEWNTFVEEKIGSGVTKGSTQGAKAVRELVREAKVIPLNDVTAEDDVRCATGIKELDRVLGGGIVPGSLVLVGGDPGIGKSTLLLQVCRILADKKKVLYISGEESQTQIKLRANRMGNFADGLFLLCETNLEIIRGILEKERPELVVIDSIQTMYSEEVSSAPGSVSQVRESTNVFMQLAKGLCIPIFIVGHVTKEGTVAGPRVLEHMVDTVLYFEGDRQDSFRLLRSVKNRFGSTDEIGVFEMRSTGMAEISDPSTLFITGTDLPGCAVTCAMEGTRPMMVEVQALLSTSPFSNPRRMAAGLDNNRLVLLLAVLEKKAGLRFYDKDVYTNVVGGIRLDERACDLAVAMCIAGAGADIALPPRTAILGELSLTGEVRPVNRLDKRIQECARLGFAHIVVPNSDTLPKVDGLNYTRVKNIREALCILGI